jgi:hypothetical protein
MERSVCSKRGNVVTLVLSLSICAAAAGQSTDKASVPLTDPGRPAAVTLRLVDGSITVTGYRGTEVVVEARTRPEKARPAQSGPQRVPMTATGLSVEENNNAVTIHTTSWQRAVDVSVMVPYKTSLNLRTVNDGTISVTGVEGEIDAENINGPITLQNVSGPAVVHSINGKISAVFDRVSSQKPMAFSTMSHDIDVTFPSDLRANVTIASERGRVASDFDMQHGAINGGGREIRFRNVDGSIYIRKGGASRPSS